MVNALLFDVFGTCVDWREGVATETGKVFSAKGIDFDPRAFADLWRAEYKPAMKRIRGGHRGYVDLDVLHRENLDRMLEHIGLGTAFEADERDALNRVWEKLPPWPDTIAGLSRLKAHHIIAPCSNGSIALMTRLAKFGGLPWDCILGAAIARNYKPEAVVYLASCAALRLEPSEVMMVAAHNGDLRAARAAGLQTAFVPRPNEHGADQTTDLKAEADWDIVAADFDELAARLS